MTDQIRYIMFKLQNQKEVEGQHPLLFLRRGQVHAVDE